MTVRLPAVAGAVLAVVLAGGAAVALSSGEAATPW
jgi:hypothetical protein